MARLVRKQVHVTAEQGQRLKEVAAREKLSEAEVIRAALDSRLSLRSKSPRRLTRDPLCDIVGVAAGTDGNAALREDHILYGRRRHH
jgi:hypothetical protein